MPKGRKTPGVYIQEINAFPSSIVSVPTAVPAFIGYTPQAAYRGESYHMQPVKITSFSEFQAYFCFPNPRPPAEPTQQYAPQYYLQELRPTSTYSKRITIAGKLYAVLPDPNTIYYLYNSVRLFYQNGGGDAYIVSVGTYGTPSGKSIDLGDQMVNTNVKLDDLSAGLALLKKEKEPTMYLCPEATLLSLDNNATLMQEMLLQNEEMGTAMSLFDIIGARDPDPVLFMDDITTFRENTGTNGLEYGVAYYPFIGTTITQSEEVNYTNLFGGDLSKLAGVLGVQATDDTPVGKVIKEMRTASRRQPAAAQYHQALLNASPDYKNLMDQLLEEINLLPVSGAMAGVYTNIDNMIGVWKAPANVSIVGAVSLPIKINNQQQESLNVDPFTGKSVNAIRSFPGRGLLVWGARTLDGNSNEGRYISTRRTLIYIEQSCKEAILPFVFEPNDQNTWTKIKQMVENFLVNLWKQGGLAGAKTADAYYVICGLNTTMTAQDIQEGRLIVMIGVAMVRPVEFMTIRLELKMADE
jgi:phage tail sheath protein FI